jgi:hypothetical protein
VVDFNRNVQETTVPLTTIINVASVVPRAIISGVFSGSETNLTKFTILHILKTLFDFHLPEFPAVVENMRALALGTLAGTSRFLVFGVSIDSA